MFSDFFLSLFLFFNQLILVKLNKNNFFKLSLIILNILIILKVIAKNKDRGN